MREKVVKKLLENDCTNIISLFVIIFIDSSPTYFGCIPTSFFNVCLLDISVFSFFWFLTYLVMGYIIHCTMVLIVFYFHKKMSEHISFLVI